MKTSIEVNGLTKKFGNFIAVDNITFNVKRGEIFGFLGANGSGKTTTIRMLCTLILPTHGSAKIAGYDIVKDSEKIKKKIGYMSQKFSLYDDLTIEENITFFAGAYSLNKSEIDKKKEWLLNIIELKGKEKRLTSELPTGWKQRLALGCAILHDPEIIFLDEPTSGVDPVAREKFWHIINSLSEKGVTIFVTTHYLDEAEYCNKIALINKGKIIAADTPYRLKTENIKYKIVEIVCSSPLLALKHLEKEESVVEVSLFGSYLHITIKKEIELKRIINALRKNSISIKSAKIVLPTLEDLFIHLINKERKI